MAETGYLAADVLEPVAVLKDPSHFLWWTAWAYLRFFQPSSLIDLINPDSSEDDDDSDEQVTIQRERQ